MLKNLFTLVLFLALVPVLVNAQDGVLAKKAPIALVETAATNEISQKIVVGDGTVNAPWVAVDTMQNAYGPAIAALNPIAYDQDADVVALVYRGRTTYAAGSGQLWYSISTNRGVTWRRVSPINSGAGVDISARYPSMAIGNATGGGLAATTGLFSWPNLNPGAFGFLGYGAAEPLGGTSPNFFAVNQGPPAYSSQVPCWTSGANYVWSADNGTNADVDIFVTQDFATITKTVIPSSEFGDGGNVTMGGVGFNGIQYLGFLGTFPHPNPANPMPGGWYPGYFKSTNNWATYTTKVVDFRTIPALADYDRIYDYKTGDAFVSYEADINVDKDGFVHIIIALSDTNVANKNSLVELIETSTGWNAKIIVPSFPTNFFTGTPTFSWTADNTPGLGQMGPSGYLAFDKAREVMVAAWCGPKAPADTISDIFYSFRRLNGEWSTPVNITNTPDINETGIHLAPTLNKGTVANEFTAFAGYWYQAGATTPAIVTTSAAVFYVAPVKFLAPTSAGEEGNLVNSFELGQNYPNPFNPSTKISFTLAQNSDVTLKVYDVLGREVMTLASGLHVAGTHQVSFDASELASGLYIYTINAGSFTSSKKMMLMK